MRRWMLIGALALGCSFAAASANAQEKITGPWLWMIAPTAAGQGGAASTDLDQLDAASGGKVTEEMVAKKGVKKGDKVGKLSWTEGKIAAVGGNNVNDAVTAIGLGAGDINDHSAYAFIVIESTKDQPGVLMRAGSDDSIKIWLNGEVIWKNAINRGAGDFQDRFPADIRKGDNLLLVKVSERGGGWSMFIGIDADFKAAGKQYRAEGLGPPPKICFSTPKKKIEGPWLWMMAPTLPGQGGAASTDVDSLKEASKGKVTEEMIAKEGPREGDKVGDLEWTEGTIEPAGGNNVNDVMNKLGLGVGDINDHSAYAYINVVSSRAQDDVCMAVGSDDSIKVWLNGEEVWKNAINRGAGDFQDRFLVDLLRGDNPLLVKVSERGGGWSMFVGLDTGGLDFNTKRVQLSVSPAGKAVTTWGLLKSR